MLKKKNTFYFILSLQSCIASDGDGGDGVVADPFIGRLLSWFADFLRNNFAMNN